MRKFAETYPGAQFVQATLAQITWYHNIALMEKLSDNQERIWYAEKTIENGWSRNVLAHQIESNLYQRQAVENKSTNFDKTLPAPQSELVKQTLKDPYVFDFLAIEEKFRESELEDQLLKHITKFLLELGAGFAFIGNQYPIEVSDKGYSIDLLFYHLKLRCFIVIELKTGEFKPEYAGKMNFYLSAVDEQINGETDNPSIGILLCKTKDKLIVEYALRDMSKPMGVSEYKIFNRIPDNLKEDIPDTEDFESELIE